ncbi:LysR substrate-binding domain-containing protein [Pseudonocardia nematodicida]|uniref:LysR substrate-binding domain-containing protein n=2 Tax=Pseudonocardia nematodicida TaxID=1206997 RepID=A0ABV1KEH2_9PSEU
MDLEIRQLRAVVAVADAASFSDAAAALGLAQSSLSRTVQAVERRVGVALFRRTTRSVQTTTEGAEVVALARHVLAEHGAAMAHLTGYLAGVRGHVTIAALPSLAAGLLPPALAAYRENHRGVTVTVHDGLSTEVLDRVRDGTADLGLTVLTGPPAGLHVTRLVRDTFHLVTRDDDPLAARGSVAWADLRDRAFVAFDPSSSIRAHTDRVLAEQGIGLGPVTGARNILAVGGLVAAGLGVSAVPGLVLPLLGFANLARVPLRDPEVRRDVCMIHNPRRPFSPAASALLRLLHTLGAGGVALPPGVERTARVEWAAGTERAAGVARAADPS